MCVWIWAHVPNFLFVFRIRKRAAHWMQWIKWWFLFEIWIRSNKNSIKQRLNFESKEKKQKTKQVYYHLTQDQCLDTHFNVLSVSNHMVSIWRACNVLEINGERERKKIIVDFSRLCVEMKQWRWDIHGAYIKYKPKRIHLSDAVHMH